MLEFSDTKPDRGIILKELLLLGFNGLGVGAVFAMIAMSLNVIYGASSILNFAQGYMIIVGSLLATQLMNLLGLSILGWVGGLAVVMALTAIVMGLQGLFTLLPLKSSTEQHSWLVTTLAAATIIGGVVLLFHGPETIIVKSPFPAVEIGGIRTSSLFPLALLLAFAVYGVLSLLARRTNAGLAMQAIRQDLDASQAAGVPVRKLQLLAFVLSGAIIGLIGYVFGPVLAPAESQGVEVVLNGFTAAVVGGIGNNRGALIAGPILGLVTVGTGIWIGSDFQRTLVLLLLIAILIGRPQGIFGRMAARRV